MAPHCCQYCQRLELRFETKITEFKEFQFYFPLKDINDAFNGDCLLFQYILSGWQKFRTEQCGTCEQSEIFRLDVSINFLPTRRCVLWFHRIVKTSNNLEWSHPVTLDLYTPNNDTASQWISTRPINVSPDTPDTYGLARTWLSDCTNNHNHKSIDNLFTPLRLIEIRKESTRYRIKLVASNQCQGAAYVALSYCWGGDQKHKTTKRTLSMNLAGIDYEALPKTIQDAIKATWEIGCRHIWIDSMCIVQDDEEEKPNEIAKMPQVYSSAVYTIAAASASRATDGFLARAEDPAFQLSMFVADDRGTAYGIALENVRQGPLEARGWTLQERLLSTRILEFGHRQLRWHCEGMKRDDALTDGWTKYPEQSPEEAGRDTHLTLALSDGEDLLAIWRNAVEEFTQRQLTVATDRALAISGIADRLGKQVNDTYIAGHWLSTLPKSLLWQVMHASVASFRVSHNRWQNPRPTEFLGPSWSWTSVNHKVDFARLGERMLAYLPNWETRLQLCDYRIELQHELAPYGSVRQAILILKGPLRRFWSESALHSRFPWHNISLQDESCALKISPQSLALDYPLADFPNDRGGERQPVYILEVGRQEIDHKYVWELVIKGLVLREITTADGVRRFARLGIFNTEAYVSKAEEGLEGIARSRQETDVFLNCNEEVVELV